MALEISLAEFSYFRSERLPFEAVKEGSRLLLYACVETSEPTELTQEMAQYYGKAGCVVKSARVAKPDYDPPMRTEIGVGLHYQAEVFMPVMLFGKDEPNTFETGKNGAESLRKVFFDLFADHSSDNPGTADSFIRIIDGYLIGGDEIDDPVLEAMMATHGGEDDGSAGVREPHSPRDPLPILAGEAPLERGAERPR